MASSRWKRFAFFERQTLNVPKDVLEDLIPVTGANNSAKNSLRTLQMAANQESVSLTVSTAALPLDTKPAQIVLLGKKSKQQQQQQQSIDESKQQQQQQQEDSVSLMWSSLTACTVPELTAPGSTESSKSSVRLPSQGQAVLPAASQSTTTTTTTVLDGLVLGFAASKDSALVHCFDLTVRCNPPSKQQQESTNSNNATTALMEDMDGWRGYWNPFAKREVLQSPASAMAAPAPVPKGVLHTAACRIPAQGLRRSSKQQQHSALHLACLGPSTPQQHQIAVWEDPHLHLSCRKPLTAPSTIPNDCTVYLVPSSSSTSAQTTSSSSLQQPWNATNDGNGTVIGIIPGMVAVGTDTGVVLVYSYFQANNNNSSSKKLQQQSRALQLKPYLRIPPPPATGLQVVSVQLALAVDKANVFVAYNRETTANSSTSTSTNTGSMNTAGICCYDVPLPTLSSQILSAPSARHDLDGRYVGSSSLVDSYHPEKQGLRVTVVCINCLGYCCCCCTWLHVFGTNLILWSLHFFETILLGSTRWTVFLFPNGEDRRGAD